MLPSAKWPTPRAQTFLEKSSELGASINGGTPKWMIYRENDLKMDDLRCTPIFGNPQLGLERSRMRWQVATTRARTEARWILINSLNDHRLPGFGGEMKLRYLTNSTIYDGNTPTICLGIFGVYFDQSIYES